MSRLLKSSKFWTLVIDVVISLILYFGVKYLSPTLYEDVEFFVLAIQPIFLAVIGGIAWEDAAAKRAGQAPRF